MKQVPFICLFEEGVSAMSFEPKFSQATTRLDSTDTDLWKVHSDALLRLSEGEDIILMSVGDPDLPTMLAEAAKRRPEWDQLRHGKAATIALQEAEFLAAEQLVRRANDEREKGDVSLAALLNAEALKRDHSDSEREANHRRRLAADLKQCRRPAKILFHDDVVHSNRRLI